jgi:beta-glucosidase
VSFFGLGSANFLYSGGGSGGTATSDLTLKNTFEAAGFSVNPTLWDFYAKSTHKRDYAGLGSGSFKVDEVPQSEYTEAVKASYASYADVAIVVVTRVGSEGIDLATDLAENPGHGYLAQTPNEKALIEALQANDTFSNIIVIANTTNAIELGWINQYSKIKACLTLAGAGQTGLKALPRLLTGEVNPSAHLVDTWAYDSLSAPSALNFGDQAFTNSDKIKSQADSVPFVTQFKVDLGNKYTVYQEGIYIGYRYYETRYEDVVNGLGNPGTYDYQSVVQYPFGYGLSYTSFEETLTSVTVGADTITYKVHVKNTGSVAGKDVVEAYFQSPYTSYDQVNGIEKSAIELCGFAKTALLAPNEESDVSISVEKSELRSYNAHWNSDKGGYIVDGGDYYFAIGEDVHDALNNILAKKGSGNASKMTASGNAAQAVLWNNPALDETTYHNPQRHCTMNERE